MLKVQCLDYQEIYDLVNICYQFLNEFFIFYTYSISVPLQVIHFHFFTHLSKLQEFFYLCKMFYYCLWFSSFLLTFYYLTLLLYFLLFDFFSVLSCESEVSYFYKCFRLFEYYFRLFQFFFRLCDKLLLKCLIKCTNKK